MKISDDCLHYAEAFLRLFYPAHCGVCKALLELQENNICWGCKKQMERLKYSPEEAVLEDCLEAVDEAWGLFPYDFPVKELIAAIKFMKKRWLIRTFDEMIGPLAATLAAETHYDAIIPIPLSRQNLINREFNQAELIAARVSSASGLPVQSNLLQKRRHVSAQSQLTREERKTNPWGAFETRHPNRIKGKSFLLVDDVITTGATADEAARTLKLSGAKRIGLFALARTPREL